MQKKQKIGLVVSTMLIVRFFLLDHIARLSKDYDVTLIVNTRDMAVMGQQTLPVRVIHLEVERKIAFKSDLAALLQLFKILKRERFDLVHSISPKTGLLAMVAGFMARVPIRLHTFQGEVWATRRGFWRVLLKNLDRVVATLATHLLVVSRSEQSFLIENRIIPKGKSTVLASGSISGVDAARFKPDPRARAEVRRELNIKEDAIVFLYLGRLTVDKGVLDLAAAFARILEVQPDVHLVLVGPDEEGVQQEINRLHPACRHMHFCGYAHEPERYLAASDVLCLPSYREGFGMVIIEAAAAGIPAIGSRIYGITDAIVENETGLLFEAGNPAELSGKMALLAGDSALRKAMGERAMRRAHLEFLRERVLSATLDYYHHLLPVRADAGLRSEGQ